MEKKLSSIDIQVSQDNTRAFYNMWHLEIENLMKLDLHGKEAQPLLESKIDIRKDLWNDI